MKIRTIKTTELTDAALDWVVAVAEGNPMRKRRYSTDWSHGGPIIEREDIAIMPAAGEGWRAYRTHRVNWRDQCFADGPTPLIAAMRCYAASKRGDEIDVPEGLL